MKLTGLEHTSLLVAAASFGAKVLAGTPLWLAGIILGVGIATASFVLRKGWQPSISP
jgi:hypothetical protein